MTKTRGRLPYSAAARADDEPDRRRFLALVTAVLDCPDERQIIDLAAACVACLANCRLDGVYLGGWSLATASCRELMVQAAVEDQLSLLGVTGGLVTIPNQSWAGAIPVRSSGRVFGSLVVVAATPPSAFDEFRLRMLADHTGAALANVGWSARQKSLEVKLRSTQIAHTHAVDGFNRVAAARDRLLEVAMRGEGEQGVARAVHELTGFPVTVEDRDGTALARAGAGAADRQLPQSLAARRQLLERARRANRPVRANGRLVAVTRPGKYGLAVLALHDTDGRSGEVEEIVLAHGAAILEIELARQHSLAETELRLGRDLIGELLAGAAALLP